MSSGDSTTYTTSICHLPSTQRCLISMLGLWDDLRGVSEYVRVFVPLLVALVVARALGEVRLTLPLVGLFYGATGWFSVLAIPVVTNAFNMWSRRMRLLPCLRFGRWRL